jgi:hypothetical protein
MEGRNPAVLAETIHRAGGEGSKFSIDKSDTHGNILWYENYSYHKLSSLGIKVPDREPWETKIVQRRETLHGNEEESRQEKETLSERMLVSELSQWPPERSTSRGAFPFSLFAVRCSLLAVRFAPAARKPRVDVRIANDEQRVATGK